MYIVKKPIKMLSAGIELTPGQRLSGNTNKAITQAFLDAWLTDGTIAEVEPLPEPVKPAKTTRKKKTEGAE